MKNFLLLISIIFIFASCKKEAATDSIVTDIHDSYHQFEKFKASSKNNYVYTVSTSSWVGYSTITKIQVKNGIVVGRIFTSTIRGNDGALKTFATWNEGTSDLNSNQEGAASLTLDEVYHKAKNEWLKVDKSANQIYFEAKNNGLISNCGYVPNGCADDCFFGIRITEIKPI